MLSFFVQGKRPLTLKFIQKTNDSFFFSFGSLVDADLYPSTRIKIMVTHYFVRHVHVLYFVPNFFMVAGREKKNSFQNTSYFSPASPAIFFTSSIQTNGCVHVLRI